MIRLWWARVDGADDLPTPARSHRRARVRGCGIVGALILLAIVPSAVDLYRHDEPGQTAIGFVTFGMLVVAIVPYMLANSAGAAWHLRGERNHLLAARTLTGWRTIDLTRIRTVRYISLPSKYRPIEYVIVTDANGSRIGFRTVDTRAMRWIRDAVVATGSTGPRVSPGARLALGIDRHQYHRYRPCRDGHPTLALLVMVATWFGLILAYGAVVSLFVS
jgi:hypothetical protein